MKQIDNILQTFLAVFLMDMCACTDDMWRDIYNAMSSNNGINMNLKSSCPWIYRNGRAERVYSRCLDLDRVNRLGPVFTTNGRCQPVFCYACMDNPSVGYTCVHNYPRNILLGKRNGGHDPYACPLMSLPIDKDETNQTISSSNDTKPIVKTMESTTFSNLLKQSSLKTTEQPSTTLSVRRQTSPLYKLLFTNYLLDNNAQFQPKNYIGQPPLFRPLPIIRTQDQILSKVR